MSRLPATTYAAASPPPDTAGRWTDTFVCPRCRSSLTMAQGALACAGCAGQYPVVADGIPLLLASATTVIHDTYAGLHRASTMARQQIAQLKTIKATPTRAAQLMRWEEAYRGNQAHVDAMQDLLRPHLSVDQLADAAFREARPDPATMREPRYLHVHSYVRRDWSGRPECEAEVTAMARDAIAALERYAPDRNRVLVLGAGLGRVAYEVTASAREVVAVDNSLAMAASLWLLRQAPRTFYEIRERNVVRADDHVRAFEAAVPAHRADGASTERLRYVVADARAVPLPDASVSAILSIYFTDVGPVGPLLAEASRLLVPGGLFYHFGPLSYQFFNPADQFAVEDLAAVIRASGYDVRDEHWVPLPFLDSAGSLLTTSHLNWSLSAQRRAEVAARPLDDADVLTLASEVVVQERRRVANNGEEWLDGSLVDASGLALPIGATVRAMLSQLDGHRTIGGILSTLAARPPGAEHDGAALLRELDGLVRRGVLVARRHGS
jgi:carnosine N-methyltransferase